MFNFSFLNFCESFTINYDLLLLPIVDMELNSIYSTDILWLLGHSIPCPVMTILVTATHLMSLLEVID